MDVGFTGTRDGMTRLQRAVLISALATLGMSRAHHGDCVGADAEFANLANACLEPRDVVVHPPTDSRLRARAIVPRNQIRDAKPYLDRNRDIVDECGVLVATPKSEVEQGGTWRTIDYARERGRPLVIVWPDGRITAERLPPDAATAIAGCATA